MLSSIKAFTGITLSISLTLSFASPAFSSSKQDLDSFYKNLKEISDVSKKVKEYDQANLFFSSSISPRHKKEYLKLIERSIGFWSKKSDLGKVNVVVWHLEDVAWANEKYLSLTNGWYIQGIAGRVGMHHGRIRCLQSSNSTKYIDGVPHHIVSICHDPKEKTPWAYHVIGHEITHVWQMSAVTKNTVPLWLLEGGATYYGLGLTGIDRPRSVNNFKNMYRNYSRHDNYGRQIFKNLKTNDAELCKFLLETGNINESNQADLTNASYKYGSVVVDKIIKRFGHDNFIDYYKSFEQSDDQVANFKKVFGVEMQDFCDTITSEVVGHFK